MAIAAIAVLLVMEGCKNSNVNTRQMAGTMDEPVPSDVMPDSIQKALDKASRFHNHSLMSDEANEIAVEAIDVLTQEGSSEEFSTHGYGIVITKGPQSTTFPNMRHTRQPMAKYNAQTGDLWLTTSAVEGTGVHVDWLHQIRFDEGNMAFVKTEVNPYGVQQELLERLRFHIEGETITLYDCDKQLTTVTNTVTDMGGFDNEQPLWIGEQLYYDVSGDDPQVVFVPGVKYTTGLVLTYDDMPELTAPITIDKNGLFTIHEISVRSVDSSASEITPSNKESSEAKESFTGKFVSDDDGSSLTITARNDDRYNVVVGLFRLTSLDDGVGVDAEGGIDFTATDAAGEPIGGRITFAGDMATLTFVHSTWSLIENGAKWEFKRQ